MDFSSINYWGVLVAAITGYAVGAVYYMVLGKPWMKAARLDPAAMKMRISPFVISFLAELVMALVLSIVLDDITFAGTFSEEFDMLSSVTWSVILWAGLVATILTVNHRYQGHSWALTVIDAGHWLLVLVVMAAVLGWFGPADVGLG